MITLRQAIEKKSIEWDKAIVGASTERVALELLREKKRWLCHNDLFYLCGLIGLNEVVKYPEIYRPFCDEVSLMNWVVVKTGTHKAKDYLFPLDEISDDVDNDFGCLQRMYLAYRTFYKTSVVTKAHSLQLLINFPNIHIVICHNKQDNASGNLIAIKNSFLSEDVRRLFPDYIPNTKDWGNMREFSVACRTDWNRDEHNITAVGVDTKITGGHWQVAKKNDLENEDSVNTEEQMKKTREWDEMFNIGNFDSPEKPIQDYEGTRYHYCDLYSRKLSDPRVKTVVQRVLDGEGSAREIVQRFLDTGIGITNPARFTREGIIGLLSNPWIFYCQMMLTPDDPAKRRFTPEMIRYYTSLPRSLNNYLLVDPASRKKKTSDYSVLMVVGLSAKNEKYVLEIIRDKLDPKQRVNTAIELAKRWNVQAIGWEHIGLSEDTFYFEEERRKEWGIPVPVEIKASSVAKEDRILNRLFPEYANLQWLWPPKGNRVYSHYTGKSYDPIEDLEYEFLHFPLGSHDDLLDAMSFVKDIPVLLPKDDLPETEDKNMTFGEYAKIREDRLAAIADDPWLAIGRG